MPYDPYEEVFDDTNKELSDSEKQLLTEDVEESLKLIEDAQQVEQPPIDQGEGSSDGSAEQPSSKQQNKKPDEDARQRFRELLQQAKEEDRTRFPNIALLKKEAGLDLNLFEKIESNPIYTSILAPATGFNDTITDAVNIIPGVNIRKNSTYQSNVAEGIRDISAIILPMLMLRRGTLKAGANIHASKVAPASVQRLGNDATFKWFSAFGADIGAGVVVDSVASQNYEDQNLSGMLIIII